MKPATFLLFNGTIFSSLRSPFAEAIALRGNRIVGVGALSDLDTLIGPDTKRIDLGGRAVAPGFIDSHLHPIWCGLDAFQVDLSHATGVDEMVTALASAANARPGSGWIIGVGYDQANLRERRHPLAAELQRAAPGRPVVTYRTCRHMAVASSIAIDRCGDLLAMADDRLIERDEDGSPTGLLKESALELLASAMPALTLSKIVDAIDHATRTCLRYGITSVTDAAIGMRAGALELEAYLAARRGNRLHTRAELALLAGPSGLDLELLLRRPFNSDEWLRVGPLKLFMDGAAGAGTAKMTEPYKRGGAGTDKCGLICLDESYIQEVVPRLIKAGKTIMTHAIGDAAIDRTLAMLTDTAHSDFMTRRHRIEHVTFVRPDQIRRMAQLGVTISVQPVVIQQSGDLYREMLGPDRARQAIPMRSLIEAGLRPAASSDAPVSSIDPLVNVRSMVARKTATGHLLGPEQTVSIAEAIQSLTESAAYIGHREGQVGTLEVGKLADLVVLSADPFLMPECLDDLQVDLTILDGNIVFDRSAEL